MFHNRNNSTETSKCAGWKTNPALSSLHWLAPLGKCIEMKLFYCYAWMQPHNWKKAESISKATHARCTQENEIFWNYFTTECNSLCMFTLSSYWIPIFNVHHFPFGNLLKSTIRCFHRILFVYFPFFYVCVCFGFLILLLLLLLLDI